MPTTPLGIWTPGDGDDWDLTVDWAANAISIDEAISDNSSFRRVANAAERDSVYPTPLQGDSVFRLDTGWEERYYGQYNPSSNPGGASQAGWYPVGGAMPRFKALGTSNSNSTSGWNLAPVAFGAESYEEGGFTSSGSPDYLVTVPYPGIYDISGSVSFASSNAGTLRAVTLWVDGAELDNDGAQRVTPASSGTRIFESFTGIAVQSTIQLRMHTDSVTLNTTRRILQGTYQGPAKVIRN